MGGGSSAVRGRIMVVDDDAVTARFMAHVLGKRAAQAPGRGYRDEDMIRSTARYWSRFGDTGYAEAFEVIRESGGLPAHPVPDHTAVPVLAQGGDPWNPRWPSGPREDRGPGGPG